MEEFREYKEFLKGQEPENSGASLKIISWNIQKGDTSIKLHSAPILMALMDFDVLLLQEANIPLNFTGTEHCLLTPLQIDEVYRHYTSHHRLAIYVRKRLTSLFRYDMIEVNEGDIRLNRQWITYTNLESRWAICNMHIYGVTSSEWQDDLHQAECWNTLLDDVEQPKSQGYDIIIGLEANARTAEGDASDQWKLF
jgi:hypothetical protein